MKTHPFRRAATMCILWSAFTITALASELYAHISVEGGLTHEKTAQPGQVYEGSVTLLNQSDQPQEVKVYKNDYWFDHEGRIEYRDPASLPRSNASWIRIDQSRVMVPPKDRASIRYTLTVPSEAGLQGTYWSLIMVEGIPESSSEAEGSKPTKQPAVGILQVMRYAVQVITHIQETGTKEIKFLNASISTESGQRLLYVDILNTGERLVRPQVYVEIFDSDGKTLGRFQGERYRLYPTTSRRFSIDISSVPPGTYRSVVIADCGDDDIFGITYTLTFKR